MSCDTGAEVIEVELPAGDMTRSASPRRTRTAAGTWIDVSMVQTTLHVNEHVHHNLCGSPDDQSWIRSLGPGDHPVLSAANGETVVVSGHPAQRDDRAVLSELLGGHEIALGRVEETGVL